MSARNSLPGCPQGWGVFKIGEILSELPNGKTLHQGWSPQCKREPAAAGEWGVLKTTAIQAGEFQPEHNKALPEALEPRPSIVVEVGDLLLTCAGPRSRCGVPCLVRKTPPRLMMSGKMYRFRPRKDLALASFIELQLLAQPWQDAIDGMKTGISDSGLNLTHSRFRKLPVHLPTVGLQHRIVAEIETQFTRLDAAVATLEKVQVKLKAARASVLKAAVEGRLVPTEADLARAQGRSYEPASVLLDRILAERKEKWPKGKKYKPPVEPDTEGLPELLEGWVWGTLDGLAEVTGGITKNKRLTEGREVPYLRVANVQRGHLDLSVIKTILAPEDKIEKLRLVPGDVLLNEGGDRDKLGRGWIWEGQLAECIHQNHVFRARVYGGLVLPRYLSHYANSVGQSYFIDTGKQTTNLASISLTNMKKLPVAVPPLAEQTRIVAEVERRLSVLDYLEGTVERNLLRCTRLRQSILKRAFEGKLVPQDPKDEPASELLARIQAQTA